MCIKVLQGTKGMGGWRNKRFILLNAEWVTNTQTQTLILKLNPNAAKSHVICEYDISTTLHACLFLFAILVTVSIFEPFAR
mgnify:CR=1 FL=1